jgi:hypothetical protein
MAVALVGIGFNSACVAEPIKVLFLSKSSGFQHSAIKARDDGSNHVADTLAKMASSGDFEVVSTKDASTINAKNLQKFDVVIFYTTGDLTAPGTDKTPVMSGTGVAELKNWIAGGGGFMGYHCASDTFHMSDGSVSPYLKMLGGEFKTHGAQFKGKINVIDKKHPTMKGFEDGWEVLDEWYVFKNKNKENMHVLATLDPGRQREKQAKQYDIPNYPVIWCSTLGEGRVYYNAMGHREDVWDNEAFQNSVWNAIKWADGSGKAKAEPNYAKVVED